MRTTPQLAFWVVKYWFWLGCLFVFKIVVAGVLPGVPKQPLQGLKAQVLEKTSEEMGRNSTKG